MTIDAEFLTTLNELTQAKMLSVGGKSFSTGALYNLPLANEPSFPSINLATLDSLVDYATENKDDVAMGKAQIVCAATKVELLSPPWGENRKRDALVIVNCQRKGPRLGEYLDLETFRLQLMTQFVDGSSERSILAFISKLTDSSVLTSEDDGVSQTVTAKTGMASFGQVDIPSPISLSPFRTFEEIGQPEGDFVFRMKKAEKGGPLAGLFELDTNWQRRAAIAVREYLKQKLPTMTVLA